MILFKAGLTFATAVVTPAIERTWAVRFAHIWLTCRRMNPRQSNCSILGLVDVETHIQRQLLPHTLDSVHHSLSSCEARERYRREVRQQLESGRSGTKCGKITHLVSLAIRPPAILSIPRRPASEVVAPAHTHRKRFSFRPRPEGRAEDDCGTNHVVDCDFEFQDLPLCVDIDGLREIYLGHRHGSVKLQ